MTQNDTRTTMQWYKDNHDSPPFDPDGMCLKICRTARNIASMYPSALSAQEATPGQYRVYSVDKIKQGMVMFFDDPNDSNPYGHIVTVGGRVKGADPSALGDLVVWSNSVVTNKIVAVRADYFSEHWGDKFQFAATWLNGVELDLPEAKTTGPKPPLGDRPKALLNAVETISNAIEFHEKQGHDRLVRALKRDRDRLREHIRRFSTRDVDE